MNYDENWVEARNRELLEDLEQSYPRRFDQAKARRLVEAYLLYRGAEAGQSWSKDDRDALASGAAMALLGKAYRPPSPTGTYGAPVDLTVAFNAVLGLGIAAADWQRHHTDIPDSEDLREILASLVVWLYPISETCMDMADAARSAATRTMMEPDVLADPAGPVEPEDVDDIDVVVVEAKHAFRSAELIAHAAAHIESDYLSEPEYDAWTNSAAVCAGLYTSVEDLRRATGAT